VRGLWVHIKSERFVGIITSGTVGIGGEDSLWVRLDWAYCCWNWKL